MGRGGYAEMLGYKHRPMWPRVATGTVALLIVVGAAYAAGRGAAATVRTVSEPAPVGARTTDWPGATRMEHRAPVGYSDTELGAVQAATNYDSLEEGALMTDPAAYRAAYATVVAPAWRAGGADHAERALTDAAYVIAAAHQGKRVSLLPVAFSYHLDSFSPGNAEVTVWSGVAFGVDNDVPATLGTHTARYSLAWLGDWRIAGRGEDQPGPGFIASVAKPQSSALPPELGSYKGYHNAP